MGMVGQPRYFNVRDAAVYLGIGEDERAQNVLYQWVHRRAVPFIKIGPKTLRFDRVELDKWLARRGEAEREVA